MRIRRRDTSVQRALSLSATLCSATLVVFGAVRPVSAQSGHDHAAHSHAVRSDSASDSAFVALQARGKIEMGVDQYTSTHRFDDLADGGRIELTRDASDSAGVSTIREHLASIARAFANGDFSTPFAVHARGAGDEDDGSEARRDHLRVQAAPWRWRGAPLVEGSGGDPCDPCLHGVSERRSSRGRGASLTARTMVARCGAGRPSVRLAK